MKCAICNNEISDEEIEENCITCIISDAKGITISEMAELWQARAEKAEGELKAIKARIDPCYINQIIARYVDGSDLSFPSLEYEYECSNEISKQIGGEK